MKCPICEKGNLENKKIAYELYGKVVGEFEGEKCNKCEEEFFNEEQEEKIEKKVRAMGLWGLVSHTKARQSGSNLSITIPKKLQQYLNIKKGTELSLVPEDDRSIRVNIEE